jgi:hypothetical protein
MPHESRLGHRNSTELCLTYHATMTARLATPADATVQEPLSRRGCGIGSRSSWLRGRIELSTARLLCGNRRDIDLRGTSLPKVGRGTPCPRGTDPRTRESRVWKLISRVFTDNTGSRALVRSLGFREVGIYEKHGYLDGVWRDVVIVERLIPANLPLDVIC